MGSRQCSADTGLLQGTWKISDFNLYPHMHQFSPTHLDLLAGQIWEKSYQIYIVCDWQCRLAAGQQLSVIDRCRLCGMHAALACVNCVHVRHDASARDQLVGRVLIETKPWLGPSLASSLTSLKTPVLVCAWCERFFELGEQKWGQLVAVCPLSRSTLPSWNVCVLRSSSCSHHAEFQESREAVHRWPDGGHWLHQHPVHKVRSLAFELVLSAVLLCFWKVRVSLMLYALGEEFASWPCDGVTVICAGPLGWILRGRCLSYDATTRNFPSEAAFFGCVLLSFRLFVLCAAWCSLSSTRPRSLHALLSVVLIHCVGAPYASRCLWFWSTSRACGLQLHRRSDRMETCVLPSNPAVFWPSNTVFCSCPDCWWRVQDASSCDNLCLGVCCVLSNVAFFVCTPDGQISSQRTAPRVCMTRMRHATSPTTPQMGPRLTTSWTSSTWTTLETRAASAWTHHPTLRTVMLLTILFCRYGFVAKVGGTVTWGLGGRNHGNLGGRSFFPHPFRLPPFFYYYSILLFVSSLFFSFHLCVCFFILFFFCIRYASASWSRQKSCDRCCRLAARFAQCYSICVRLSKLCFRSLLVFKNCQFDGRIGSFITV